MHALVKGACGVTALALLGAPAPSYRELAPAGGRSAPAASSELPAAVPQPCPPRSLPVATPGGPTMCLPLPGAGAQSDARLRRLAEEPPSAAELKLTAPSEVIPRLPERPASFGAYQLPVDPDAIIPLDPTGAGRAQLGVRLEAPAQTPVTLVDLEDQAAERPEVVLVGELVGITVVVRHHCEGEGGARDYFAFYGNLARPGPSITSGARLSPLAVIGFVAPAESDEPYLYFEVRQADAALDRPAQQIAQLLEASVAVDARNVLPLAP